MDKTAAAGREEVSRGDVPRPGLHHLVPASPGLAHLDQVVGQAVDGQVAHLVVPNLLHRTVRVGGAANGSREACRTTGHSPRVFRFFP